MKWLSNKRSVSDSFSLAETDELEIPREHLDGN